MMEKYKKKHVWEKMKAANAVAVISIICTFAVIVLLFFIEVPVSNKEVFTSIISFVMGTLISGAVFYLFGYEGATKKANRRAEYPEYPEYHEGQGSCPVCMRSSATQLPGEDNGPEDEEEEPVN